jgi:hypothetical protein
MPRDPRRTTPPSPARAHVAWWAAVFCQALVWSTGAAISHPLDVAAAPSLGAPESVPCAEDADCNDGNGCNGVETCHEGACRPGSAPSIGDGNPCTIDSCDPIIGGRNDPVPNGTPCSDGNLCNGLETCQEGTCRAGVPPAIGDNNPCTIDVCDPMTGARFFPVADGTPCSDRNRCNGEETCQGGICTAGVGPNCDDGDPCTLDTCTPADGCQNAPDPECPGTTTTTLPPVPCTVEICADGDPCTVDGCRGGRCANDQMEGVPSAACVCQRPDLAPCLGEQLPRRIVRSLGRACNALTKAIEVSQQRKVTRLVRRAAASWREAQRRAGAPRSQHALSPECMSALEGALLDARKRSEHLIETP